MTNVPSRRRLLQDVAGGTCLTTLGAGTAVELGLTRPALAEQLDAKQLDGEQLDGELTFGELEPLVCLLQETPLDRLQGELVSQLSRGLPLKTLTAAGALANARTFGGEDYSGLHTFMALSPALRMSSQLPPDAEALPVLKVLYRSTKRIQECGGSDDGALHAETYFQTLWDDFHISRPASQWLHLVALARVTASEFGRPADGQAEAN